jgi:hypothetical protein
MSFQQGEAAAGTLYVEQDGSGDFTVIQDAVDAAASGDTIRVGVGRFDEKEYYSFPGWSDSVRVVVHQHELTIIGSGDETIIGQLEPWEMDQGAHKGIVAGTLLGNSIIRVENLRFDNMREGLYTSHTSPCEVWVNGCSFYANLYSLWMSSEGGSVEISDCNFLHMPRDGAHVAAWGQTDLVLRRCTLRLLDYHQWSQSHLSLVGVQQALVEDCEFLEGAEGIKISYGGPTTIRNCQFDGQSIDAIFPAILSIVTVGNCEFRDQNRIMEFGTSDNQVTMLDCVVEDVADCTFQLRYAGIFEVHRCDLARGSRGTVWVDDRSDPCDPVTLDMTDNYWGTDNPDSIAAWIRDRNDSDQACFYIDYEPYRDVSTPVESMSLSEFKALMRGGGK